LVVQLVANYVIPVTSAVTSVNGVVKYNYTGTHPATRQQNTIILVYIQQLDNKNILQLMLLKVLVVKIE
jgi:hypothetical protein